MKYFTASFCFVSIVLLATAAAAQNGAYSSYFDYTVTYNGDGSADITPTAEVSGIDDVSDWIEGQYRPVCTVRPKIQLNGDGDWIGGTRVALGRAVDQVRTGSPVHVPADGSTVGVDYSVEADVTCSGAPNQAYYQYPSLSYLPGWSYIDLYFWYNLGFSPFQTNPPSNIRYCPSAVVCPVAYGVASINNFVDFADFANITVRNTVATYQFGSIDPDGWDIYGLACPNGNQNATCGEKLLRSRRSYLWAEEFTIYITPGGCFFINTVTYYNGYPAPFPCR